MTRQTAKSLARRTTSARARQIEDASVEGWPIEDGALHALDDPDTGLDASAFYRWRRVRSEPPPPLGPSGSGLAHYRRRDRDT